MRSRLLLVTVAAAVVGTLILAASTRAQDRKSSEVPVGTIVAYGGALGPKALPENWLLCDGRPVKVKDFSELFEVVQSTKWPGHEGPDVFSLPNLQGYFLRGVDPAGSVDPDKRDVGTVQGDCFGQHRHGVPTHNGGSGSTAVVGSPDNHHFAGSFTDSQGGPETRPKNVAIHWIIKAK